VALAERGEYREALEAAQRPGLMAAMRGLDARGLLTLGDVARYAGAARTAERVFLTLVDRFPGEPPAADAVFSLGRLAFERDRPAEAARWFQRYVSDWSAGPLGDQAAGRLVECHLRAGDRPAARAAARAYLARAPRGTHAPLARKVLAEER
jgi:TolA-binding protein